MKSFALFLLLLTPVTLLTSCAKDDPYGYDGNGLIVEPEHNRNGTGGDGNSGYSGGTTYYGGGSSGGTTSGGNGNGGTVGGGSLGTTSAAPVLTADQRFCPMEDKDALKADIARRVSDFFTSYKTTIVWETPVEITNVKAAPIDQTDQGDLWATRCLVKIMQEEVSKKYPDTLLPYLAQSSINITRALQNGSIYVGGLASSRSIVWLTLPFIRQENGVTLYTSYADQVVAAMRRTFNHEMLHAMDFKGAFSDTDWKAFNVSDFSYKTQEETGFAPRQEHPLSGFATGYAATDSYEDRAETFVYMILTTNQPRLEEWIRTDTVLKNKAQYLKTQLRAPTWNFSSYVLPIPSI